MRTTFLALVLAAVALFAGCIIAIGPDVTDGHNGFMWNYERGSGVAVTQTREVADFHAIRIEGSCDVEAKVGGARSVSVTTDDNLIDDLVTRVEDGVLVITTRDGAMPSYRVAPLAKISVPALDGVSIDGSGDVAAEGIASETFKARISGSGDMRLSGRATRVELSVSGSGDSDLAHLEAKEGTVSISGSGDARVFCSTSLSISISGSGDVHYLGSPHTSVSISGSGDVLPLR